LLLVSRWFHRPIGRQAISALIGAVASYTFSTTVARSNVSISTTAR